MTCRYRIQSRDSSFKTGHSKFSDLRYLYIVNGSRKENLIVSKLIDKVVDLLTINLFGFKCKGFP